MVAYIFLIIAFVTTFMIAFPTNDAFALIPTAFVKVMFIRRAWEKETTGYYYLIPVVHIQDFLYRLLSYILIFSDSIY